MHAKWEVIRNISSVCSSFQIIQTILVKFGIFCLPKYGHANFIFISTSPT